jgi:hypothetical protein
MQRRFHRRQARFRDVGDLVERIAEHVHQDNAAALRHRQAHESPEADGGILAVFHRRGRISDHVPFSFHLAGVLTRAAAQQVERRVMRDAKEPRFGIVDRRERRIGLDRLDQRLLHRVFAIDDRAGHPGAIAMELRPQFAEQPVESGARIAAFAAHRLTFRNALIRSAYDNRR